MNQIKPFFVILNLHCGRVNKGRCWSHSQLLSNYSLTVSPKSLYLDTVENKTNTRRKKKKHEKQILKKWQNDLNQHDFKIRSLQHWFRMNNNNNNNNNNNTTMEKILALTMSPGYLSLLALNSSNNGQ